jgi:hypothetical protein
MKDQEVLEEGLGWQSLAWKGAKKTTPLRTRMSPC